MIVKTKTCRYQFYLAPITHSFSHIHDRAHAHYQRTFLTMQFLSLNHMLACTKITDIAKTECGKQQCRNHDFVVYFAKLPRSRDV